MKRVYAFYLLICVMFFSCAKEENTIVVEGKISDPNLEKPLAGADIILDNKPVSSSVYNAGYQTLTSTTSGSDGSYKMEYEKEKSLDYRIRVRKDDYFLLEKEYAPEKFESGDDIFLSFNLLPKGYVKTIIKNKNSFNDQDHIIFQFTGMNGNSVGSCPGGYIHGYGKYFDTSFVCAAPGNDSLGYEYEVTKNGSTNLNGPYSEYISAFDTTLIEIDY